MVGAGAAAYAATCENQVRKSNQSNDANHFKLIYLHSRLGMWQGQQELQQLRWGKNLPNMIRLFKA
jgi:hypothetical protein